MFTIHLKELLFYSFHGLFPEEKVLGNEFEVNVSLGLNENGPVSKLEQTVNYASVYEIIKQRMLVKSELLETVAQDLAFQIHQFDGRIRSIEISIIKKYPPMSNLEGSFGVSYKKEY